MVLHSDLSPVTVSGAKPFQSRLVPYPRLCVKILRDLHGRRTGREGRRPKVSVEFLAYNEKEFVAQALETVLSQKASFEWEIVVGDDCSTDGTQEILKSYARDHPGRIRLLLRPHQLGPDEPSLGGRNNFLATYRQCRGEYIALLEGDDYWTDDRKLEKQVAFLDEHPDCSLCCHATEVEYSDERPRHWDPVIGLFPKEFCTLEDLLRLETKPEVPTSSMMIRRRLLRRFPSWFNGVFNWDYAIHILLAEHGKVGFLPGCMAIHRKHGDGASRLYDTDPDFCNAMLLKLHVRLNEHFDYRYRSILDPYIEEEQRIADAAAALSSESTLRSSASVIPLALEDFVSHSGRLSKATGGGLSIVTAPIPWAYAASLALPASAAGDDRNRPAHACVRVRTDATSVGIGVLNRDGAHFLDRRRLVPSEGEHELRLGIPRLREAGDLIVQTWGEAESGTIDIHGVELVVFSKLP
jgi:glycosyltransferase involved in cell wall biosynthesis